MSNQLDNIPKKHHYLPVFYLKQWAGGEDGKLCQFSRPYGNLVKPLRVHPHGTGYVDRLYAIGGLPDDLAHQIEEKFFKPADMMASEALHRLVEHGSHGNWAVELRSAWSRFLVSLLLRTPQDVDILRVVWKHHLKDAAAPEEEEYRRLRGLGDPETFAEYLGRLERGEFETSLFTALMTFVDNPNVGGFINEMHWRVFDVDESPHELLTSDRGLIWTPLKERDGHLALPIGPKKLFVAASDRGLLNGIDRGNRNGLARIVNQDVVTRAVRFVYGTNDTQLRFVQSRFGANRRPRLLAASAARRGIVLESLD